MATVRSRRGGPAVTDVGTMRPRASVATQVSLKLSQTGSCGSVPPTFAIPSTSPQANHSPAWCVRHAVRHRNFRILQLPEVFEIIVIVSTEIHNG